MLSGTDHHRCEDHPGLQLRFGSWADYVLFRILISENASRRHAKCTVLFVLPGLDCYGREQPRTMRGHAE